MENHRYFIMSKILVAVLLFKLFLIHQKYINLQIAIPTSISEWILSLISNSVIYNFLFLFIKCLFFRAKVRDARIHLHLYPRDAWSEVWTNINGHHSIVLINRLYFLTSKSYACILVLATSSRTEQCRPTFTILLMHI